VREVRVIGADAEQLGVMTPEDALEKAREVGLDLVEVAANSKPPVCRIMDYGRYKYEQKKKRTGQNKKAHAASLKEVKLRPGTDLHDLEFKLNNARRFLMEGDKVKITVMFRGREMVHTYRGREQLDQVLEHLKPIAKLENPPRMEGRFMSMILVADREAVDAAKKIAEQEAASGDVASGDVASGDVASGDAASGDVAKKIAEQEAASEDTASGDAAESESQAKPEAVEAAEPAEKAE
jgi:translation initiation factor IF-3